MLEIRGMTSVFDILDGAVAVEEHPEKEISFEEADFVLVSRENYYKLKEYEATCSGLF
jgi:hypothetical protein